MENETANEGLQAKPNAKTEPRLLTRRAACKVVAVTIAAAACRRYAQPATAEAKTKKKTYYKIVYKLNGGTNPKSQRKKLLKGSTLATSKLKKPTRKGYTFAGWYSNKKLTKKAKKVYGKKATSKRRLYAKWTLSVYKITYHINGGQAAWATLPTSYTYGDAFTFPLVLRAGYSFLGWYRDSAFKTKITKIKATTTGKRSLYAKWVATTYWQTQLNSGIAKVNALFDDSVKDHADAFVFVTDMHLPNSSLVSPELIKQVRAQTDVDKVIFGGDALNGNTTAEEALAIFAFLKTRLSGGTTWYLRGNHDSNDQLALDDPTWALSEEQYRQAMFPDADYLPDEGFYYYRDNEDAKIRYLLLDTGHGSGTKISSTQIAWLKARILELSEGWTVLVLQHRFFKESTAASAPTSLNYQENGTLTYKALDGIYDEAEAAGVTIAGVVCGHCHRDYSDISDKGYPMISTTCDAGGTSASKYDPEHPTRTNGTTTESAFDVVVLNTQKRRINLVRFGCGTNRVFSY